MVAVLSYAWDRGLAGVSPTPFDAGCLSSLGQPVFEEDVLDDSPHTVVQRGGDHLQNVHQDVAALDRNRPDQLARRGGKEWVAEHGFGLAALDHGERTRFGGHAPLRGLEEEALGG